MRLPIPLLLLATLGLARCGWDGGPADLDHVVEITGQIERSGGDGASKWTGAELVRVLDYGGSLLCEGLVTVAAVEAPEEAACTGCAPSLEIRPVRALAPRCAGADEIEGWANASRYLAFQPDGDDPVAPRGDVWLGDEDGTWTWHARGVLHEGRLAYQDTRIRVRP